MEVNEPDPQELQQWLDEHPFRYPHHGDRAWDDHPRLVRPAIRRRGVRSPRQGREPATWTRVDRDYETLRIDIQTLFTNLGIATGTRPVAADNISSVRVRKHPTSAQWSSWPRVAPQVTSNLPL